MEFKDFVEKRNKFSIGEFTFKEPTVKETFELRDYFNEANEKNVDEITFYIGFLSKLLIRWTKEKLEYEVMAMSVNNVSEFFFYVLEKLGINFTKTLSQKPLDGSKD